MTDWGKHFREISRRSVEERLTLPDSEKVSQTQPQSQPQSQLKRGPSFGGEMDTDSSPDFGADPNTVKTVQARLNALGMAQPPLNVDGSMGPLTQAAIKRYQSSKGLSADGIVGQPLLSSLGITSSISPTPSGPPPVHISTVIAALRQAAKEKGYTLSNNLLSLMIGQLRGAEGAFPGVGGTLGGTNNMGAAQVTAGLASAKKGLKGWGAFAHKDSSPDKGPYIGWYWIAPSPLEAARHWFGDNWWGAALAKGDPQNATDYSAILYRGGYYEGNHPGGNRDPNSDAGKLNVADYAAAVNRGRATSNELSMPSDDPAKITVNPSQFMNLAARKITPDLFEKAISGGIGSAWKYLLPQSWNDLVKSNGVVWFGPPVTAAVGIVGLFAGMFYWLVGGAVIILGYSLYNHGLPNKLKIF